MNAKNTVLQNQTTVSPTTQANLRVLSANQRKMVKAITNDWRKFTYGMNGEMFDKI